MSAVLCEITGTTAVVTINRPKALNAGAPREPDRRARSGRPPGDGGMSRGTPQRSEEAHGVPHADPGGRAARALARVATPIR